MPEPNAGSIGLAACPTVAAGDPWLRLERIRARGAGQCDTVGWYFIEALARRAAQAPVRSRAALARRLTRALDAHEARLDSIASPPGVGSDAGALGQASLASPFAPLLALLAEDEPTPARDASLPQPDLKALRHFRRSWARLHTEHQLAQALTQAPENAGPLNSQHLLLQAMTRLRRLSPDYLEAFIGHADTLLWLEQAGATLDAARKTPTRSAAKAAPSPAGGRTRKTTTRPGKAS